MRRIERTGQFKRDYRREAKRRHAMLDAELMPIVKALANDLPLDPRHRDHALTGDWKVAHIGF
jgi:mRNA interferase YafQ